MGKIYVSSDWHGCGDVAKRALNYLKEDDTLYFLGDAIDRGNDGANMMLDLLEDSRVIYLKGNHEDFFARSAENLLSGYECNFNDLWLYGNGGFVTWERLIKLLSKNDLLKLAKRVSELPQRKTYVSTQGHHLVIMEHAGFSPFSANIREKAEHDPLWDREHFHDRWTIKGDTTYSFMHPESTYIVHGHTPVQYLKYYYGYYDCEENVNKKFTAEELEEKYQFLHEGNNIKKPEIIRYCDGHKFDIDMCTISSNRIALLDLDTFETVYID